MTEDGLIQTGIAGLDEILMGGIPRGNAILLKGVTGSGTNLMGIEFIYRGITQFGKSGLIVVFETSPDKLIRDTAKFGWHLDELRLEKKLQIIFTSPQVFEQELRSTDSLLLEAATEISAQRIFIDGVAMFDQIATRGGSEPASYRDLLHQHTSSLHFGGQGSRKQPFI